MRALVNYFRANPQVFVLFMVCLVLGLGTFIAVLVALVQSGNSTPERGAVGCDRRRRRRAGGTRRTLTWPRPAARTGLSEPVTAARLRELTLCGAG